MRTSSEWLRYFRSNAVVSLLTIPWEAGSDLSLVERRALAGSLRGFQEGESSEGRHLLRYAQRYADRTGDHDYVAALRLFIAEEHRHGRDLGRLLTLNGVTLSRENPLDRVFRWLRHLLGTLEVAVTVLITAEIISEVYYAVIRRATGSTVLRGLCDQILRDEEQHVAFQAQQLGRLRAGRGRPGYALTRGLEWTLFAGTCVAVWIGHGPAIRACGESAVGFWSRCWRHFGKARGISAATREALGRAPTGPWPASEGSPAR